VQGSILGPILYIIFVSLIFDLEFVCFCWQQLCAKGQFCNPWINKRNWENPKINQQLAKRLDV
jgi:hypothetical protein